MCWRVVGEVWRRSDGERRRAARDVEVRQRQTADMCIKGGAALGRGAKGCDDARRKVVFPTWTNFYPLSSNPAALCQTRKKQKGFRLTSIHNRAFKRTRLFRYTRPLPRLRTCEEDLSVASRRVHCAPCFHTSQEEGLSVRFFFSLLPKSWVCGDAPHNKQQSKDGSASDGSSGGGGRGGVAGGDGGAGGGGAGATAGPGGEQRERARANVVFLHSRHPPIFFAVHPPSKKTESFPISPANLRRSTASRRPTSRSCWRRASTRWRAWRTRRRRR